MATDVFASFNELDAGTQERLAEVLELRGADAQQQALRWAFLSDVAFAPGARVLEVGCGTGVLTRTLARREGVGEVIGIDPARSLIAKARELSGGLPNLSFREGDGRSLPFDDEVFDVVVFDSVLSHVPEPGRAVAEAHRVLQGGGQLAIFDGDYATTTVALGANDPLQACVEAMMANSVHDRWVMRRLPALVRECGSEVAQVRSHGLVESAGATYMPTIVERGADFLRAAGLVGPDLAAALKAEVRQRLTAATFFGHIAYASLVARRQPR